jgi:hypothetical protein
MPHALSYQLPRRSKSSREFDPNDPGPPLTPPLRELMTQGPSLDDLWAKARVRGRKQPWYGNVEGLAEQAAMKTLARLDEHVQWSFWAWELIARPYPTATIRAWGLRDVRLVCELWIYADYFAADASFLGSAHDCERLDDEYAKVQLMEGDGVSERDAETQIQEWKKYEEPEVHGGPTEREHEFYATPEITVKWSPVTVIRPGEEPIISRVGNDEEIIRQLLAENELSMEEARSLVVGRPSEAEKERRDRLAVAVYRLRNQNGAKLEGIGSVLGCHKSTVLRLARDGESLIDADAA